MVFDLIQDPIFTEAFDLTVEESNRFLNVSVWSARPSVVQDGSLPSSPTSSPSKRSKVGSLINP